MSNSTLITLLFALFTALFTASTAFAQSASEPDFSQETVYPSYWHSGFELSLQGGPALDAFILIPLAGGVDWSISAGWHGEKYGFTLQFEHGYQWPWSSSDTNETDCVPTDDGCSEFLEGDSWFNPAFPGHHGAATALFDIYFPHDSYVFRVGLGLSIFFGLNSSDEKNLILPMVRVELGWSWLLTDSLRLGIELEISTVGIYTYLRPSAVLTYAF